MPRRARVENVADLNVEEVMADVERMEAAPEPGTLHMKDIIHKGDMDMPVSMVTESLTSAGWVYIYDRNTGERSVANRNNLRDVLRKKDEDGKLVFTLYKPAIVPRRGTLKCMLHAEDPNRAHYDDLGLPTCRKSNLTSAFQVTRHMQARHKTELATIEQERRDKEREEETAFRRTVLSRSA